jgi:hypothetical protein
LRCFGGSHRGQKGNNIVRFAFYPRLVGRRGVADAAG